MSSLLLKKKMLISQSEVSLSGSKSETNRLLIINALYNDAISLQNISNSEDSQLLQSALKNTSNKIDIHHAGTAMRFLTAYFSIQANKSVFLTGSDRMKQRPIGILVEALKSLGADISYGENHGFPPLLIKGRKLVENFVELDAHTSSQFITALLLIGSRFPAGLRIQLNGKITSKPYLEMTVNLLNKVGIETEFHKNFLHVKFKRSLNPQNHSIESDWSSASYYYSMMALSKNKELRLNTFYQNSLQGDSEVYEIYREHFGVQTEFLNNNQIKLSNSDFTKNNVVELNLNKTPDLAQTIAVTCAILKQKCKLTGLETLKIKETDRLLALKNELLKIGAVVEISEESLEIIDFMEVKERPKIKTYNDHRMALSFTPYSLFGEIEIENPDVIQKSYPQFWEDFRSITVKQ